MLELPTNFEQDIAGRDTNLVPVVTIGTISEMGNDVHVINFINQSHFLSTNSGSFTFTSADGSVTKNYLPLLLNIPSLKESIDIEKRNYKISSITLDISNFPYNGKRFSELVSDKSLINTEVRIYWTSPSTNLIHPQDYGYNSDATNAGNHAFQIYFGTIRRYTHDDEKVRLVVEDRSQSTLHKDFPTANLETGSEVPDKYKNKPIPMVYGHVDKSPLVRYASGGQWILQADSVKPKIIAGNTMGEYNLGSYDQLYLYADNLYMSIIRDNQFSINELDNTIQMSLPIPSDPTSYKDELDILECYYYLKPRNFDIYEGLSGEGLDQGDATSLLETISDLGIFFDNDLTTFHTFNIDSSQVSSPDNGWHWVIRVPVIPDEITYLEVLSFDISINGIEIYPDGEGFLWVSQKTDDTGNEDIVDAGLGDLIAFGSDVFGGDIGGIADTADIVFKNSTYDDLDSNVYPIDKEILVYKQFINYQGELSPTFMIAAKRSHFGNPQLEGEDFREVSNITIKDLIVRPRMKIEKVFQSDFYANVKGRAMLETVVDLPEPYPDVILYSSPPATHIIAHIMENELGVLVATASIPSYESYDTWKYAFTVDKKTNSKKLIEGLASASPYIPRFNNMGEFKFDTIPLHGGDAIKTINAADCISYNFSRTKIEDVYTKIEFKYNWDYARGEFNSRVFLTTDEIVSFGGGADYDPTYYGFKIPEGGDYDHAESTLVIDDDRGKYIRDKDTAQKFVGWFLSWSCNQHLQMKIKLPLKYMNLEIGDLVDFDAILGDVIPYGINYLQDDVYNGQLFYKNFLITSTNKTLEWVEIECIQMHYLEHILYVEVEEATSFLSDIPYATISSEALDGLGGGVSVSDLYTLFPELGNLVQIMYMPLEPTDEISSSTQWNGSVWQGTLTQLYGGTEYTIIFSEDTTTNLFSIVGSATASGVDINEYNIAGNTGTTGEVFNRDLVNGNFDISDLSIKSQSVENTITGATFTANQIMYDAEITTDGDRQTLTFLSGTPVTIFNTNKMEDLDVYNHIYTFTITTSDLKTTNIHRNIAYTFNKYSNIGDINGDGKYNVLDVVALSDGVISGNCKDIEDGYPCDLTGDGGYNVLDITTLANSVLSGSLS